jgi:hypothetical protein
MFNLHVCLERSGIKTNSLEWTVRTPLEVHTFIVPPFFITTGSHYLLYRKGCNVLRGINGSFTSNPHILVELLSGISQPVNVFMNVRRCHIVYQQPIRPRDGEIAWNELRMFKFWFGFILNVLLELTLSALCFVLIFIIFDNVVLCMLLNTVLVIFCLKGKAGVYAGLPSSTMFFALFNLFKSLNNDISMRTEWLFLCVLDIILFCWLVILFILFIEFTFINVAIFIFIIYTTYRKGSCGKPTTLLIETVIRICVFIFDEHWLWYNTQNWVLFAIFDIICVATICQLVCYLLYLVGLNPASYYIVYLTIVLPFFCVTFYDNQSCIEPSSFVLHVFFEYIGFKWYLKPTATWNNWYMASDKTDPKYEWDIAKRKTIFYILRNFIREASNMRKKKE